MAPKILLVEGKSDFHLIRNLLGHHNLSCTEASKPGRSDSSSISIEPKEGINVLLDGLEVFLRRGELQQLGIVVDANQNPEGRWEQLKSRILSAGVATLPDKFPSNELHFILNRSTQPDVKVGIWMMPDNQEPGYLEHFASQMIPEDDSLWFRAINCVAQIPQEQRLFSTIHTRKAELHTWLAWQEAPGKPMGQALTFRYLDAQAPIAQRFVAWATQLFTQ